MRTVAGDAPDCSSPLTRLPGEPLIGAFDDRPLSTLGPVVGVLALQGDVLEHVRMLSLVGARAVAVRHPEQLADLDGILLPGGESTTIGTMLTRFGMLEPLRARLAEGLPALGTCAGAILLASQALLADGTAWRSGSVPTGSPGWCGKWPAEGGQRP